MFTACMLQNALLKFSTLVINFLEGLQIYINDELGGKLLSVIVSLIEGYRRWKKVLLMGIYSRSEIENCNNFTGVIN